MDILERSYPSDPQLFFGNSGYTPIAKSPVILAVDDDEDNLVLLTYALEPLECKIITAVDGHEALEIASNQQPDLILLDIMLYPIDGIQIISQLRQNPQTKNIPVVAVTALARPEDRKRILDAGCNDYITKPYLLDELESLICRYLGREPSGDKALATDLV
jgi:CheY-like chemotaxis protein